MDINSCRQTRLTNNPSRDEGPTWSLDGVKIVFNSNLDDAHDLIIINRDGSRVVQLSNNSVDDDYAVWKP